MKDEGEVDDSDDSREPADVEALEQIWAPRWRDPAFGALTADAATGFAVWLPNIPLREGGLQFVPRKTSLKSWAATLDELGAFLYPLIRAGGRHEVIYKALQRLGYVCERVVDPSIDPRGPWWYFIAPLLGRFFDDGIYVNPRAFLPHTAQRAYDSWTDPHPFEADERRFTMDAARLVKERLLPAGIEFTFVDRGHFPWPDFSGALARALLPHLADPIVHTALVELLARVLASERGDVGRFRAPGLAQAFLDAWEAKALGDRNGPKLEDLLPEYAPHFSRVVAERENLRRMEEGGY